MSDLLSAAAKASIRQGFKDLSDTFDKTPVVFKTRKTTTQKAFGEGFAVSYDDVPVLVRLEPSKASGERYINVDDTPKGKEYSDGIRIFVWKETLDTALGAKVLNPETDRVLYNGLLYEIRMSTEDEHFSDIGPMRYVMDLTCINREGN